MMLSDEELLALQKDQQPDDSWLQTLAAEPEEPEAPSIADLIAQRGPDPEEGQYERKFSEENQPQASWKNTLAAIAAGIAESTGTQGAVARFHENQAGSRRDFEKGLANARQRDNMHRFVDPATADMMVRAGLAPQDAANMRGDSQAMKLAPTLGQLATRQRGQEMQADQKMLSSMDAEERQRARFENQNAMQDKSIAAANTRAANSLAARKKPGGGLGAPMSPEAKAEQDKHMAAVYAQQANTSIAEATAFMAGDIEGLDPAKAERLQMAASDVALMSSKDRSAAIKGVMAREGANPDRIETSTAIKQNDPQQLFKVKQEIDTVSADLIAARNAWRSMSPGAKAAMAKYGGEGGTIATFIKKMSMTPAEQAYASELQNLANALIKAQSGAAVSVGEWGRLADRMGFAKSDFDVFNSPATIDKWLGRMLQGAVALKKNAIGAYGEPLRKMFGETNVGR